MTMLLFIPGFALLTILFAMWYYNVYLPVKKEHDDAEMEQARRTEIRNYK